MSDYTDEFGHFDIGRVPNKFPDKMLESLLGLDFDFYGVDSTSFCIGQNGARLVLEAVENPDDGYRSYFGCFATPAVNKIFFGSPIARVTLKVGGVSDRTYFFKEDLDEPDTAEQTQTRRENFSGWVLQDVTTGHVWLTVGTDYGEDYYPTFVFRYTPDTNKRI